MDFTPNKPNVEEFYESFKNKLDENHNFPENFLFKFVIPNQKNILAEIFEIFDGLDFSQSTRDSKNGKYISLSINAFMMDSNQVIHLYKEVSKVSGVIML